MLPRLRLMVSQILLSVRLMASPTSPSPSPRDCWCLHFPLYETMSISEAPENKITSTQRLPPGSPCLSSSRPEGRFSDLAWVSLFVPDSSRDRPVPACTSFSASKDGLLSTGACCLIIYRSPQT